MSWLQSLITLSMLLALGHLALLALLTIVSAVKAGGRRDTDPEDQDALSMSRFTIPVSIVIPPGADADALSTTIDKALGFNYPELEVIAVIDDATTSGFGDLAREWQLEARECFYRQSIGSGAVRRLYRSARDARLVVVDKEPGSAGDALNCGVNLARFRYVMTLPAGITFDRNALLRTMAAASMDPAHVIGASSHVEWGCASTDSSSPTAAGARLIGAFQRLASLRSLMATRLTWRHSRNGLVPQGAVVVWRRDAILKAGGFSLTAPDIHLDLLFRVQQASDRRRARFHRGSDIFGSVPAQPVARACDLARARQQSALQIFRSSFDDGWRSVGKRTWLQFVESEVVTPLAQLWLIAGAVAGAAVGWYAWTTVGLAVVLLSFGSAAVTAGALLLRGAAPGAPDEPELRRLLLIGPLDVLLYRPALALARLAALPAFARRPVRV